MWHLLCHGYDPSPPAFCSDTLTKHPTDLRYEYIPRRRLCQSRCSWRGAAMCSGMLRVSVCMSDLLTRAWHSRIHARATVMDVHQMARVSRSALAECDTAWLFFETACKRVDKPELSKLSYLIGIAPKDQREHTPPELVQLGISPTAAATAFTTSNAGAFWRKLCTDKHLLM